MTAPSFFDRTPTITTEAQMRERLAQRTQNCPVAQPVEQRIVNSPVGGSNPPGAAIQWSETRYCTDSQGRRTPDGYQVSLCGRYRIERSTKLDKPQYTAYQNKPWKVFGPYATAAEAKAQCTP